MSSIDLLPHQSETVEYLEQRCSTQHGILVYHNMGTGKTNTGVAWLIHRLSMHQRTHPKKPFPFLIVCPELIKSRWFIEAEQMGFHLTPAHICNYEEFTLQYIHNPTTTDDVLARTALVFDEAHHIAPKMRNNNFEHYSKFMNVLSERHTAHGQRVMLLTGTPEYSDRSDFSMLLNIASGATQFPINERDWYNRYKDTRKVKARATSWTFNFGKPLMVFLLKWITGSTYFLFYGLLGQLTPSQNPEENKVFAARMGISSHQFQTMSPAEFANRKVQYIVMSKYFSACIAFFTGAVILLNYLKIQHDPTLALRATPIDYKKLAQDTGRYVSFYHNTPDNTDYATIQTTPPIFSQYTDYQSKQSMQFLFGTMNVDMVKFYTGITDEHEVQIRVEEFRTIDSLKRYGRCISNTWEVVDMVVDGTASWKHCSNTGTITLESSDIGDLKFIRTLERGCPKFNKLLRLLSLSCKRHEKSVVRSDFKEQGTYLLSAFLTANQIDHIYVNTTLTESSRQTLLKAFNHQLPVTCSQTGRTFTPQILLLDAEASEGISLLAVEHMHLLEPMTHISQRNQSVARAVRYRSHQSLSKEHRNVSVYTHVGTLDTKHLEYKGLAKVLNNLPMGMSKLLRDPKAQATSVKMSFLHWRNIESHLSKHFAGIVPRTGFKLIDYFINPTRFLDYRYTKTTTADTLVMADLEFMQSAQSAYMTHALSENVLAKTFVTPTDCVPNTRHSVKTRGFAKRVGERKKSQRKKSQGKKSQGKKSHRSSSNRKRKRQNGGRQSARR